MFKTELTINEQEVINDLKILRDNLNKVSIIYNLFTIIINYNKKKITNNKYV